ncbi:MAG: hypothetical protein COX62_04605 [Deltaproteobacteria bacterium CG_4_10_14_0_2_um_filter_43_8]|nr:MAG: hypothetical protein COV43_04530 [Deltaproteobacteria bacterium CG11_big_fil_rev_8_21_14_0_20_42_23]PJA20526.1 MAG: hypothetical protein COX62_04605 [Deltaproteobacteria bacterium CG_4_10_14_0_2_um_filter_43_8]PJC65041.1 MAG: hypothetical protein CO021_00920 [Deltaproteobacteria bacterium CG_4_9_14_0_2_um_filter_42_21]
MDELLNFIRSDVRNSALFLFVLLGIFVCLAGIKPRGLAGAHKLRPTFEKIWVLPNSVVKRLASSQKTSSYRNLFI